MLRKYEAPLRSLFETYAAGDADKQDHNDVLRSMSDMGFDEYTRLIDDFRLVCDTLDLESSQERAHINAFKTVGEAVEAELFGERVFTYSMRGPFAETVIFTDTNQLREKAKRMLRDASTGTRVCPVPLKAPMRFHLFLSHVRAARRTRPVQGG